MTAGIGAAGARRATLRDAVGIAVAAGAYAVSFGAISVASGLSVVQTCVLSLVLFSGASQFAFVGILGGGGGAASAIATALLLGSRNGLYGLRLASTLRVTRARRLLAAQFVIDETTAMAVLRDDPAEARYAFWSTGTVLFTLWNVGTLLGAYSGEAIGDPKTYGLDAAAPAAFLALLWPRLRSGTTRVGAVAGAAIAIALVPVIPAGLPVLAAGGVALGLAVSSRDRDGQRRTGDVTPDGGSD